MLNINYLPDHEFRSHESMAARSDRRMLEMRARSERRSVHYVTSEDGFGGRRETRDHTSTEFVKLYEGAIVGVEISEATFYGHKVEGFMVEGIEHLSLSVELIEKDNFYGQKTTKIYKIRSMHPTMMHNRTSVYEESTLFGTRTTTVHVEETFTARPTGTVHQQPTHTADQAMGELAGMLFGAALIGLAKRRR